MKRVSKPIVALFMGLATPTVFAQFDVMPDLSALDILQDNDDQRGSKGSYAMAEFKWIGQYQNSKNMTGQGSARLRTQQVLAQGWSFSANTRFSTRMNNKTSYAFRDNSHLHIQEAMLNYSPSTSLTVNMGRINLKQGVAVGFNPTDWFRGDSLVLTDSQDVSDRREDRVGVVALQTIFSHQQSLWTFGYRPYIKTDSHRLLTDKALWGLYLHRTNPHHAFFVSYSPQNDTNFSYKLSGFYQSQRYALGAETSYALNDQVVIYNESTLQRRHSLWQSQLSTKEKEQFYAQSVLGGNWSLPDELVKNEDIALILEFHLNQAGYHHKTWPTIAAQRRLNHHSQSLQEPLYREHYFARLNWNELFRDAQLSVIAGYNHYANLTFTQTTFNYTLGEATRMSMQYFNAKSRYRWQWSITHDFSW